MASGNIVSSQTIACAVTTTQFTGAVAEGNIYSIVSTVPAWALFGANPTAVVHGATATYIPANYPIVMMCPDGASKVAIIADTAAGFASLSLCVG